jgi:hypothetical protein
MKPPVVMWYLPETSYVAEIIHIVPAEQKDLHKLLNCWCQPEYGRDDAGIRTATHHAGLALLAQDLPKTQENATNKGNSVSSGS